MPKQVKYGLIICIALTIGVMLYFFYQNEKDSTLTEQNVQTTEEKSEFENDLAEVNTKIDSTSNIEDKVDLFLKKIEILKKLDRKQEAHTAARQAIVIDDKRAGAYLALHELQVEFGDMDGARETIRKYVSLNSDSTARWEKYLKFEKDTAKSSVDVINGIYVDSLVKTKEGIDLIIGYAKFLEENGSSQMAIDYWTKAGIKDPENKPRYDSEIKRLNEEMKTN